MWEKAGVNELLTRNTGKIEVYGKQPVREAVDSNWPVFEIIVRGDSSDPVIKPILETARARGIKTTVLRSSQFDFRYPKAAQGIAAQTRGLSFKQLDEIFEEIPRSQLPLFIALDGIQDPQNLGSICRTCHAMGVHGLVVPRRRSASFGTGALKSSSGAIFYQSISQVPNIHRFVQWCKRNGIWVYGLDASASTSLWNMDFTLPVALIVGSEDRGLSRLVRERCDKLASVPMFGQIDSLNAGVACAMALYEVQRQRNLPK